MDNRTNSDWQLKDVKSTMVPPGKSLKTHIHHDDPPVRDYRVMGVGLLPNLATLDLMLRLGQAMQQEPLGLALRRIRFQQPIALADQAAREIRVEAEADSQYWRVCVCSRRLADGASLDDWQEHARAEMHPVDRCGGPDMPNGLKELENGQDLGILYAQAQETGVVYGEFMKLYGQIRFEKGHRLAHLNLGGSARDYLNDFLLHPALLESAVMAAAGFGESEDTPGSLFVPEGIEEFRVSGELPAAIAMCATASQPAGEKGKIRQNIDIYDLDGDWLASLVGLSGSYLPASRLLTPQGIAEFAPPDSKDGSRHFRPDVVKTPLATIAAGVDTEASIAVIGMAGRYPMADNLVRFWENLEAGRDCVTDLPAKRWGLKDWFDPVKGQSERSYSRWGGWLDGHDAFDARFFRIPPCDAERMDPQERLFLEIVWATLEDSGHTPESLARHRGTPCPVGVFVGAMWTDYQRVGTGGDAWHASIANRVSSFFDFTGPSLAVDALCSSSALAVHLACESLRRGECAAAVAGGVNLSLHPSKYIRLSELQLLSTDGRCRAFAEGADGYVPGEGVGAVLLKPLADALAEGDVIHGVILGSAVNHTGKGGGYMVPSPAAQAEVISAALGQARVDPSTIGYVEAQGLGSAMSDPIEVEALSRALGDAERMSCCLGSVKSSIGHLEAAAGIAGLTKLLLQLRHGRLVPSLHAYPLNPSIDWEHVPFRVQTELVDWPRPLINGRAVPRRAGLSAFGAGGTNVHLIVEEAPNRDSHREDSATQLILLSARDSGSLRARAADLAAWLNASPPGEPSSLADIAHTLRVGRVAMGFRAACLAGSLAELATHCEAFPVEGGAPGPWLLGHTRRPGQDATAELLGLWQAGQWIELARRWVNGASALWLEIFPAAGRRRVALPTYQFVRQRYWLDQASTATVGEADHPVLSTSSVIAEQSNCCSQLPEAAEFPSLKTASTPEPARLNSDLCNLVEGELIDELCTLLKLSRADVDVEDDIADFGLDSISIHRYSENIGQRLGVPVNPALMFEIESLRDFATLLCREYGGHLNLRNDHLTVSVASPQSFGRECENHHERSRGQASNAQKAKSTEIPQDLKSASTALARNTLCSSNRVSGDIDASIAVIGMAGRFPQSPDLDVLWEHLLAGDDLITEVPPERWDWRKDATGRARWGGFVPGIDLFDARLFGFTPKEADLMDPQQRLFLQAAWGALESAGIRPSSMAGSDTGVFVGVAGTDYHDLLTESGVPMDAHRATGVAHSLVANRVSYVLGLHGPSEAIDTACSSSLVALHRAVMALRTGECSAALVGGVNVLLRPEVNIAFGKAGMLSPDGRCRSFSKDANGYVRGEGVGVVVLKLLAEAEAEGDPILGVIRGSAVNHGGKAKSLTAPNPTAQARAMVRAWSGIDPASVNYIEAHGTGTGLGDPVEINGLKRALTELDGNGRTWTPQSCGIGSIKSNIGHLETAAGIAGVIKVLLAMRAKRLPASLHLAAPNPLIELSGTPFYLVREARDWDAPVDTDGHTLPRRAGVNSFGFGGANAHAIIEEYLEPPRLPVTYAPQLIVLGARSEVGVIRTAASLAAWLERANPVPRLADVAHTLQVGREAWEHRAAFVVADLAELRERLAKLVADEEAPGIWRGRAKCTDSVLEMDKEGANQNDPEYLWRDGRLERLGELWANGAAVDWQALEALPDVRRIHLPPSPLEEERYWAPLAAPSASSIPGAGAVSALHPLLDDNVSSLDRLEFRKRFKPGEFIMAEHRVAGRSLLPAAAYLEICRVAAELVGSSQSVRSINDVRWTHPFSVVDQPAELRVSLYPEADCLACEFLREDTLLAEASLQLAPSGQADLNATLDLDAIRARCPVIWNPGDIYDLFRAHGFEYGPGFQVMEELRCGPNESLARLSLPAAYQSAEQLYGLHPALLDGALQSVAVLMRDGASNPAGTYLPYSLDRLELGQPLLPHVLYVHAVRAETHARFDLLLADEGGRGLARLVGFTLRELGRVGSPVERPTIATKTAAPSSTTQPDHANLKRKVSEQARAMVAELLRVKVDDIDADGEIADYGLDSLAVNDFAAQIEETYGIALNPTLFYEHPTIASLVTHLVETNPEAFAKIHGVPPPPPADQAEPHPLPAVPEPIRTRRQIRPRSTPTQEAEPIAVIGMAGRFPQSADLEVFWEHLRAGDDLITEIPAERWDWRAVYGDPAEGGNCTLSKWGGFMPDVDKFDPLCFGISPREAELMDPQQRLILQTTWGALENAGLRPTALAGSDTGVFVGVGTHDYQDLMAICTREIQPHGATGNAQSLVANRVSYVLDLHGPSEAIDTACSSSLVALHRAVMALRSGECGLAVVGGVNVLLRPELTIAFGKAGMLSPDGRCRSFGKDANGYVRGEGVGVVVLKPLAGAEADGDPILGVIRGSAVNHGGKANSLTAPNPNAQARAIVRAWSSAGVDPATVGYIEAHGTGTAMGDPVELNGMKKAIAELGGPGRTWRPASCGIGSVKSNIGHLETAAGVAGLIKVLLSLQAKWLPASLHLAAPNPLLELSDTPFYLLQESRDWPAFTDSHGRPVPRRAGVSSFGFGGTNAHVLIEEYSQ